MYRVARPSDWLDAATLRASPFWIPEESYEQLCELHDATDVPLPELARKLLAISFSFQDIDKGEDVGRYECDLLKVRLRFPAYAWRGEIAPQPLRLAAAGAKDGLTKVEASGGLEQIMIPNLLWADLVVLERTRLPWVGEGRVLFDEASGAAKSKRRR